MSRVLCAALLASLSGCCCELPFGDDATWAADVAHARQRPQTDALAPGTANVFELEVQQPREWSDERQAAYTRLALAAEVARLEVELARRRGAPEAELDALVARQVLAQQALPSVGALEPVVRYRFAMIYPAPSLFDAAGGGELCIACVRAAAPAHLLQSPGHLPIDERTVTREMLVRGVPVEGGFEPMQGPAVRVPTQAPRAVSLRLVESCPAEVALVTRSVAVGSTGGLIAVSRHEDRSWVELRKASCVKTPGVITLKLGQVVEPADEGAFEDGRRARELALQLAAP